MYSVVMLQSAIVIGTDVGFFFHFNLILGKILTDVLTDRLLNFILKEIQGFTSGCSDPVIGVVVCGFGNDQFRI